MGNLRRAVLTAVTAALLLAPGSGAMAASADDQPATELRVTLGQLLGEHAYLLMETMRAAALGQGEEPALHAALDDHTGNLRDAVAGIYGEAAGDGFEALWQDHIDLLIAYANAVREGDDAAKAATEQGLDQYVTELAAFLESANPALRADDEAAALRIHVDQLMSFIDSDFDTAYQAQREAYHHMFRLGDHLALEMARQFPDRFPDGAVAFSPRSDLRLTLDRLLGEHLVLAAQAMRAGLTGAADFAAGASALEANTTELAGAVGSVYGDEAGKAFADLWRAHIDAYVAFVLALASQDEAEREASLMSLHGYHDEIAGFLASANPNLSEEAVAGLVRRHVQALISQAEATDAGDHERAVATIREAYVGMFEVGGALAEAIVAQFPERFEDLRELPGTSTAPPAPVDVLPAGTLAAAGVGLLLLGALLWLPSLRRGRPRGD
jgi:hypothetical protein